MSMVGTGTGYWQDFMNRNFEDGDQDQDQDYVPPEIQHGTAEVADNNLSDDNDDSESDINMDESEDLAAELTDLRVERNDDLSQIKEHFSNSAQQKELDDLETYYRQTADSIDIGSADIDTRVQLLQMQNEVLQKKLELAMADTDRDIIRDIDFLHLKKDFLSAALKLFNRKVDVSLK